MDFEFLESNYNTDIEVALYRVSCKYPNWVMLDYKTLKEDVIDNYFKTQNQQMGEMVLYHIVNKKLHSKMLKDDIEDLIKKGRVRG